MQAGEQNEARRCLASALAPVEKTHGPDHPLIGGAALALAVLECREGRLERARVLLEQALRIHESQIARVGSITAALGSQNHVEALQSIGLVDESQRRWAQAPDHLGQARHLFLRGVGFHDPSVDYARVLRATGRSAEAAQVEASGKVDAQGMRVPDAPGKR